MQQQAYAESSFTVLVVRDDSSGRSINLRLQDELATRMQKITGNNYVPLDEALVPSIKSLRDQDITDALEASKTVSYTHLTLPTICSV